MENMLMPVPARPRLFPQRHYFCTNSHNPLLCQADRSDVNNVKRLKNLHIMAAAILYPGLLMG